MIYSPIMMQEVNKRENIKAYSISTTSADCVKTGIEALFKDINKETYERIFDISLEKLERFLSNEKLFNIVDFNTEYVNMLI